jgi:hypothetical protein
MMMTHDEDEAEKISEDAVDELLDAEDDIDDLEDEDEKDMTDEFGAALDEDTKSRDWE